MNHHDAFGELRSLMNCARLDEPQRARVVELASESYARWPERHIDQWLPYLRAFARHFDEPIATFRSLADLHRAAQALPMARFDLDLSSQDFRNQEIRKITRSQALATIASLDLRHNSIDDKGARKLAACPGLGALTALRLGGNDLSAECVHQIAQSPHVGAVIDVDAGDLVVRGAARDERLLEMIFSRDALLPGDPSIVLWCLHRLAEHDPQRVRDHWIERLRERPDILSEPLETYSCLEHLQEACDFIELGTFGFQLHWYDRSVAYGGPLPQRAGAEGMRDLVEEPILARVSHLSFQRHPIGPDGVRALARCPHLGALRSLSLVDAELGDDGARALFERDALWRSLTHLSLRENGITMASAAEFIYSPRVAQLTLLDLSSNHLDEDATKALAASPFLSPHALIT